jgi:hypothetical protein
MTIPDDVVAEDLKRLGAYPEAAALCQLLLKELQSLTPPAAGESALFWNEGRRNLASLLINAMELEEFRHDRRNDAAELVRSRTGNVRSAAGSIPRRLVTGQ